MSLEWCTAILSQVRLQLELAPEANYVNMVFTLLHTLDGVGSGG
jgi:hypothetical protein